MESFKELQGLRDKLKAETAKNEEAPGYVKVVVGLATCGIAAGARPVIDVFKDEVAKRGLKNIDVRQVGCIGICQYEPVVEVFVPGKEKVTYVNMDSEKALKVVEDHIVNGKSVSEYTIGASA